MNVKIRRDCAQGVPTYIIHIKYIIERLHSYILPQ